MAVKDYLIYQNKQYNWWEGVSHTSKQFYFLFEKNDVHINE